MNNYLLFSSDNEHIWTICSVDAGDSGIPLSNCVSCWKIVSSPTNFDFAFRTNFHFHRTTTLQRNITTINVWKKDKIEQKNMRLVCTDLTTSVYKDKIPYNLSLAHYIGVQRRDTIQPEPCCVGLDCPSTEGLIRAATRKKNPQERNQFQLFLNEYPSNRNAKFLEPIN